MPATSSPVEQSILIEASAEAIYPFLTDPDKLSLWLAEIIEADPQPGGSLRGWGRTGDVVSCTFLELQPPHRVLMTWGWEQGGASELPPGSSQVEILLQEAHPGTRVVVRHHRLPDELAAMHHRGWGPAMDFLKAAVGGAPLGRCVGDPGHPCSPPQGSS